MSAGDRPRAEAACQLTVVAETRPRGPWQAMRQAMTDPHGGGARLPVSRASGRAPLRAYFQLTSAEGGSGDAELARAINGCRSSDT